MKLLTPVAADLIRRKFLRAFTLTELLALVAVIAILAALILPLLAKRMAKSSRANCQDNLKQIALAYRTWEGDYGDKYPQALVGGTNLLANGINVLTDVWTPTTPASGATLTSGSQPWMVYAVMQNELNNPKVITCPADARLSPGDGGWAIGNTNCSYFVGKDPDETIPTMILSGDRNMCTSPTQTNSPNGVYGFSPSSGTRAWIVALGTNGHPGWSASMHHGAGNIGLADGSVQQSTSSSLWRLVSATGDTNSDSNGQNWLLFP